MSSKDHSHWLPTLLRNHPDEPLLEGLRPSNAAPAPRVIWDPRSDAAGVERRWRLLHRAPSTAKAALADAATLASCQRFQQSVESLIGTIKIPVGLAGPLRVNGLFARGDYYLPLATTEASLVASFSRGAQLLSEVGGCSAAVVGEGFTRTPGFAFASVADAAQFMSWAVEQREAFAREVSTTSRHAQLQNVRFTLEANTVYLHLDFFTGDAAGQNMVTLGTEAVCRLIRARSPIRYTHAMHEANLSGEKKANYGALQAVRGRKVVAEVRLPAELVEARLHTTPEQIERSWRMAAVGASIAGAVGIQAHYANGLTALFLATGQDVACVAEAAIGITRFEVLDDGALYASVTLPNMLVGTVGGATSLPSQRACLEILGLYGPGCTRAFAEVCAGLCLAGELSITGALSADEFARAHSTLARKRTADGIALQRTQLSNGMDVMQTSDEETQFFYREIFEDNEYLRGGIQLPRGACVFDVGANIGLFMLHVHALDPTARILAFEPAPQVFRALEANAQLHRVNARVFQCAIGRTTGTADFGFYPGATGASGLHPDVEEDRALIRRLLVNQNPSLETVADRMMAGRFVLERLSVPVRTLHDVIAAEGITRVDLLKIDVEKAEMDVLDGLDDADWAIVQQVVLEVHDADGRLERMRALLSARGFTVTVEQDELRRGTGLYGVYARRA